MYALNATLIALTSIIAMAAGWKHIPKPELYRHNPKTHYEKLWDTAEVRPSNVFRVDKAIALYQDTRSRYVKIQNMRKTGVPAAVIFCFHGRESTWNFRRHLHEGSPLTGRTRYVPKGRPRVGSPPFTFSESAEDALYTLKHLERKNWHTVDTALYNIEAYNGLGYKRYHKNVNSPYLWSGTNHYTRGKYVADGRFSSRAVDKQLGCCAILKRMQARGIAIGFE